jgi:hypothetical protein
VVGDRLDEPGVCNDHWFFMAGSIQYRVACASKKNPEIAYFDWPARQLKRAPMHSPASDRYILLL